MKNKLRLTALLVAVAMLSVSVLTGCGGSSSGDTKKEAEQAAAVQEEQAEAPAETEAAKEETAAAETPKTGAPTAEDARAYVQAVLDIMCTGDYDHSVELSDIPEGDQIFRRARKPSFVTARSRALSNLSQVTPDSAKKLRLTSPMLCA